MIVFARHGETARNRAGLLQGRSDAALTDLGRAQAAALSPVVRADAPARVVASPLPRAVETAAILAAQSGIEVEIDERLIELDYGLWEGRPVRDLSEAEWRRWRTDPEFAPPGGERLADVRFRVASFCREVGTQGGVVVAVSHVSPIKAAAAWAVGAGDEATFRMHLALASLTRIDVRGGRAVLVSFNETLAHIDVSTGAAADAEPSGNIEP